MSNEGPGNGWWQASDGHWYPPEQHPDNRPDLPEPPPVMPPPVASAAPPAPASQPVQGITPPPAAPGRMPTPERQPVQGNAPLILAWTGVVMFLASAMISGLNYGWGASIKWRLGYEALTSEWYDFWDKVEVLLVFPGLLIVLLVIAIQLTVRKNAR